MRPSALQKFIRRVSFSSIKSSLVHVIFFLIMRRVRCVPLEPVNDGKTNGMWCKSPWTNEKSGNYLAGINVGARGALQEWKLWKFGFSYNFEGQTHLEFFPSSLLIYLKEYSFILRFPCKFAILSRLFHRIKPISSSILTRVFTRIWMTTRTSVIYCGINGLINTYWYYNSCISCSAHERCGGSFLRFLCPLHQRRRIGQGWARIPIWRTEKIPMEKFLCQKAHPYYSTHIGSFTSETRRERSLLELSETSNT